MSKFLMSAAAAALMTAPALAQSTAGAQQSDAAQQQQRSQSQDVRSTGSREGARGEAFDWDTDHDWVNAAVYGEDGEQIGVVDRVRLRAGGGDVRAVVLNTDGFLGQGMRHIRLLGDEATVITQDKLPEGWTVSRADGDGDADGEERRWWNFGRDDDDSQSQDAAANRGGMTSLTLITLDFSNDEIAMMPEYVAPAPMQTADAGSRTDTEVSTDSAGADAGSMAETSRPDAENQPADAARADARQATQQAARTARAEASGEQTMAANAGRTGEPGRTGSEEPLSDEDSEEFQSAYGGEIGEDASDGYDRAVRAGREDVGASNDTGVNMQNGDQPDDVADSTVMDEDAGEAGGSWADEQSPGDPATEQGRADQTGSEQSWTQDDTLVGQDVYAQDETRLGSVGRVQQDGDGSEAEPIALIIITDAMGEREVSLQERDWSNQQREGEQSLTLDYRDRNEFEQDSAPYGEETVMDQQDQQGEQGQGYGQADDPQAEDGAYGDAAQSDADTTGWTDDHAWVDTAVYSRTGSQIGEIERVRGGADGAQPTALVIETNGFLDIGGREVALNGSNFRLTDYDGEQVLQIRYTEEEVEQMAPFNEAETSDYPLSDNPLENDESEPLEDDGR